MSAYKVTLSAREVFVLMKKKGDLGKEILILLLHVSLKFLKELRPDCYSVGNIAFESPKDKSSKKKSTAYTFWSIQWYLIKRDFCY